jgi:putative Mg2+ transporter-C (MgtC) family protein
MILSILVPEMYNSNINDPGRIAAQVVSWIWFLWAWAIIKLWVDTRGLTTAANIWVTAAIGLVIGAWLYFAAFAAAAIIFIDLILITEFKKRYITPSRYCTIELWFPQKDDEAQRIYKEIKDLPLTVLSKHIKEDKKNVHLKVIAKIRKDEDLFKIKNILKALTKFEKISVSESVKG